MSFQQFRFVVCSILKLVIIIVVFVISCISISELSIGFMCNMHGEFYVQGKADACNIAAQQILPCREHFVAFHRDY
jgi:hypothetical protein